MSGYVGLYLCQVSCNVYVGGMNAYVYSSNEVLLKVVLLVLVVFLMR